MESRSSYGYYGSAGGYTGENPPAPQKKVVHKVTEYFIAVWKWNGKDFDHILSKHSTSREYMEGLFKSVKRDKDTPCIELWQEDTYGKHLLWQEGTTYRRNDNGL